jgi:hypothetical protein
MDDLRLVLVEGQPQGHQPSRKLCLDLLGLLLAVAEHDHVIGVPDRHRGTRCGFPGVNAGGLLPYPGGLLQPVQRDVQQPRAGHAPNTVGNFCFEVTLGYRRLERGR